MLIVYINSKQYHRQCNKYGIISVYKMLYTSSNQE